MAAAAAAAAAGSAAGVLSVLDSLGLNPEAAAGLKVECDTAAGVGLAVARLEVEESTGQLLVVADSGECTNSLVLPVQV
jgi:hypothetical protein